MGFEKLLGCIFSTGRGEPLWSPCWQAQDLPLPQDIEKIP
jgi:hypothetical protein